MRILPETVGTVRGHSGEAEHSGEGGLVPRTIWWRMILLLAGTGLYFLANVQRVAIPGAIFSTLQAELDVSASWITWLGASFMYVYALNQLVVGFLVERHGGRRVILFGALVFCAGAILFPLSRSLFLLYLCRALVGFGASSFYLSLVHETRRTFRGGRFPLALSVVIFTGYAGGIMAGAPFVIGAKAIGWRSLLLVLGACALLCWILFAAACRMDRFPDPDRRAGRFRLGPILDLLRLPGNRNVCLCAGIHFGLYYVIQTVIGKKYLEDFLGLSPEAAAWVLSLMAVLAAISGFVPIILRRLTGGRIRMFITGAGVVSAFVCCGLVLMTGLGMRSPAVAVLLCLLSMTASLSPIAIPLLYASNAPERAGLAVCLFNFSLYFFVAVFSNAGGVLLGCFEPKYDGLTRVYGQEAWLAVFSALSIFPFIVVWLSFRLEKDAKLD